MGSIKNLLQDYQNGKTPKTKLDELYDHIEQDRQSEEPINAYITLTKDLAYQSANKEFDSQKPLSGIFVGVKDNIQIEGELTTCGSRILSNYKAINDATVVTKLKNAGAIIVGKLNMDEFAMGATNETSYFGVVRNPANKKKVAGGSSGGSAAAVAAKFATLSLGSDTGGSVRLPASYCGVVGFKPTYGAISRYGVMAMASGLDQVGPIANNVYDCALLFNVLKGYDPKDPNSIEHDGVDLNLVMEPKQKKKIGIVKQFLSNIINKEVSERFYKVVELLKKEGHEVIEVDIPHAQQAIIGYFILSRVQSFSALSMIDGIRYGVREEHNDLTKDYEESRGKGFGFEVIKRMLCGNYFLSRTSYYDKARQVQTVLFNDLQKVFKNVDVVISPTTINTAPLIGGEGSSAQESLLVDMIASLANLTATPSLSVPMGNNNEDMPMGIQILGNLKEEQIVFETGSIIEKLVG